MHLLASAEVVVEAGLRRSLVQPQVAVMVASPAVAQAVVAVRMAQVPLQALVAQEAAALSS